MTLLSTPSAAAIPQVDRFPTASLPKATVPLNGNELVAILQQGRNVYIEASSAFTATGSQSVQTQHVFDLTIGGNTAGLGLLVSSGTLTLAGGANITLSQNGGNVVTVIGGAFSAGVSTGGNSLGDTGATGSRLVLAGGPNITLSQATDVAGATVTVSGGAGGGGGFSAGVSNLGNTSGITGVTGTQLVLAGGNNITLSQSINGLSATITISAASQTVQTQNLHNVTLSGNTAGVMAQISSGTLTLAGGNNITLSQNGNAVTISAAAQMAESQSIGASNLGNTLGTSGVASGAQVRAVIIGTSNITVSQSVNGASATLSLIAHPQFSAGFSTQGNTAGDTGIVTGRFVLVGTNNITLSGSTNGGSITISISGGAGGAGGNNTFGASNLPNVLGTTGVITGPTLQMIIAAGNQITLSQSINGSSATISIAAKSMLSLGMSTLGNTGGTSGVQDSPTYVFVGSNNITLSQSTSGVGLGHGTLSIFGQPAFSGGVSNLGNTAGSTGISGTQLVLVGTNGISLSQSTGANGATVSINFTQSVQTQSRFNLTLAGNSTSAGAGFIEVSSGVMTLAGGNNITLSQNGNAVTISAAAGGGGGAFSAGMSDAGNTKGTSGLVGSQIVFAGVGPLGLSQSVNGASATLTIEEVLTNAYWCPFGMGTIPSLIGASNGSQFFFPIFVDRYVSATEAVIMHQFTLGSTGTITATLSQALGIYSKNGSTLSAMSLSGITYDISYTSTQSNASYNGARNVSMPFNLNLTPGTYWLGYWHRTSGGQFTISALLAGIPTNPVGAFSGRFAEASTNNAKFYPGIGVRSASSSTLDASVAFTQIRGTNAVNLRAPIVQFLNSNVSV